MKNRFFKSVKGIKHLNKNEIQSINRFFGKKYSEKINLNEFKWYKQKTNEINPEIIHDVIWHTKIEPYFNNLELINEDNLINKLLKQYNGNFIIQKLIIQHDFFKQFNDTSVNTMRMVTFFLNEKFYMLFSFIKIGEKDSRWNNILSGDKLIPISKDGKIEQFSYIENLETQDLINKNNLTNYNKSIPCWKKILKKLEDYHYRLSHFQIINLDITLGNNVPIIIENKLINSSSYFHQLNNGSIFGHLTSKVLNALKPIVW